MRIAAALGATLLLLLMPAMTARADQDVATEYGLREADQPVGKSPRWRKPRRVVVDAGVPGLLEAVRDSARGVEVTGAATQAEMAAAVPGADAVIGRTSFICDGQVLAAGTELRWAQTVYAGVELCARQPLLRERGILLTNMRAIAAPVIAEHAVALMLALERGLPTWLSLQARREWRQDDSLARMRTVAGKTLLVAGLGGIGSEVAKRGKALGMRVIGTRASRRDPLPFVDRIGTPDDLPALLREADVIVNALPLTTATAGLFDANLLAQAKPGAVFVNVGRGGTVVTTALVEALRAGRLGGAGLDVTDPEPLPADHPLWLLPNVIITPHLAGAADHGVGPEMRVVRENVRRYLGGQRMLSVVDLGRGY